MNLTLFEIAGEYRLMADKLADLDLPDDVIADTLQAESGALEVKATNVAFVVRNLEATAEAIKSAEAQMAARRKAIESRGKRLREYLLAGMQYAGVRKIDSPHFSIALKKNPPSVEVLDEKQIPPDYWTDPPPPPKAIDKRLILQAMKDGFDVPGCKLNQGERVEIK